MNHNNMDLKAEKKGTISLGRLKTFDSFKIPSFRLYFGSSASFWLAYGMAIANTLLLYRLTESAFIVGAAALASSIPTFILSPIGGSIADRIQKKYVLAATRAGQALIALIIGLALSTGYLGREHPGSWWLIMFAFFFNSIFSAIMQPANISIISELVGRDRLMNGISMSTMGGTIFGAIGPTLAGVLIDNQGFSIVYYLMAMLTFISIVLTLFLPRSGIKVTSNSTTFGDVAQGFQYIRRETVFMLIVIFSLCHIVGTSAYLSLTPVFTESILKVDATKLGVLNSLYYAASFLCSLVFASIRGEKRGLLMIISGLIASLAVIVFAFSRWWYLSLAAVFIAGIGTSIHMVITPSIVQTYADPPYQGRMMGLVYMGMGLGGFAVFCAGALSNAIGLQAAVAGMASILLFVTIAFLIFAKQLRKME